MAGGEVGWLPVGAQFERTPIKAVNRRTRVWVIKELANCSRETGYEHLRRVAFAVLRRQYSRFCTNVQIVFLATLEKEWEVGRGEIGGVRLSNSFNARAFYASMYKAARMPVAQAIGAG